MQNPAPDCTMNLGMQEMVSEVNINDIMLNVLIFDAGAHLRPTWAALFPYFLPIDSSCGP